MALFVEQLEAFNPVHVIGFVGPTRITRTLHNFHLMVRDLELRLRQMAQKR
jgi:hypothetical protein